MTRVMEKWELRCVACGRPAAWEPMLRYWYDSYDGDGEPCEVDIDWAYVEEGDVVECAGGFCPGCGERGFVLARRPG